MTALEVYDLVTTGGGQDFATVIRVCESAGPYCLIGGLAVNCYVEPVYTVDADLVVISDDLPCVSEILEREGFAIQSSEHSLNAQAAGSSLRIQFTTDLRYQDFPSRASRFEVLGISVRVASLEDVAQRKLWAYADTTRRFSERKKDELDLIRLAEKYPGLKRMYPEELASSIPDTAVLIYANMSRTTSP